MMINSEEYNKEPENSTSEELYEEKNILEKFVNEFAKNKEEIKLRDNKKNIICSIQKNGDNFYLSVEKIIEANDNINNLFEEIKKYKDSVNNSTGFWPNSNQEYPDLMILWEIITEFKNDKNITNGALKYPDNWEEMLLKFKEQLINDTNKSNH